VHWRRANQARSCGAFQLNALIRAGSLTAAAVALLFAHGLALPTAGYLLAVLGIGLITGVGSMLYCFGLNYLPVSLVVTLSNLYIVITIVLGIVVLHEPITLLKIAGLACLRGLPVSVASAASNASVVVTVVLSAIFLHRRLGRARVAALALTLLGVTLLALSTG
jgi:drug/metabolite transporter (DMT)-like permease